MDDNYYYHHIPHFSPLRTCHNYKKHLSTIYFLLIPPGFSFSFSSFYSLLGCLIFSLFGIFQVSESVCWLFGSFFSISKLGHLTWCGQNVCNIILISFFRKQKRKLTGWDGMGWNGMDEICYFEFNHSGLVSLLLSNYIVFWLGTFK